MENLIDVWSKMIITESSDDNYRAGVEDDMVVDKNFEYADEYEKWLKQREKMIINISNDKTNVDEGLMDNMSSWFSDTKHWWQNVSKDQKLWNSVIEQVKKDGRKGLEKTSTILVDAVEKSNNPFIKISLNGSIVTAEKPIISVFKGLKMICLVMGKDDNQTEESFNAEKLEQLLDKENYDNLGKLNGIVVVEDESETKNKEGKENDEEAIRNSFVVVDAVKNGDSVVLKLSDKGNVEQMKQDKTRAEKFKV